MITDFTLLDLGYSCEVSESETVDMFGFTKVMTGHGSEAESALDDLLYNLQVRDIDVTDLEGRIKDEWNPTPEMDADVSYTLVLMFDES